MLIYSRMKIGLAASREAYYLIKTFTYKLPCIDEFTVKHQVILCHKICCCDIKDHSRLVLALEGFIILQNFHFKTDIFVFTDLWWL